MSVNRIIGSLLYIFGSLGYIVEESDHLHVSCYTMVFLASAKNFKEMSEQDCYLSSFSMVMDRHGHQSLRKDPVLFLINTYA